MIPKELMIQGLQCCKTPVKAKIISAIHEHLKPGVHKRILNHLQSFRLYLLNFIWLALIFNFSNSVLFLGGAL